MRSNNPSVNGQHKLPNVRGKILQLPPHPKSCSLSELKEYAINQCRRPLAIDLFCGAGGLSLGLQRAGFDVLLGVDRNEFAIETHRAHFPGASIVADLTDPGALEPILDALNGIKISLVAGGPPCQPFSRAVRWRRRIGVDDGVSHSDGRRELWVPFLQAVERLRPLAVLLENVPDLAMNADGVILRRIFETFIKLDYHVTATTLPAHYFGVPQYRQRLFVVAFSSPVEFHWPNMHVKSDGSNVTLKDAIADLPPVEAGWNSVSPPYEGPITDLQMVLREGIPANQASTVWDHVTRAVRADDAEAFRLMDSRTSYQDLPAHLKRYDDENFTDKYNRLSWDQPSRAITAHLARDGYGYIHPDQHRTLTIREAARIQSFPDRFRFAGFPVSAFRQIGEAVAPLVAEGLAKEILSAVNKTKASRRKRSVLVSRANFAPGELKAWVAREPPKNSATPWRLTGSLWLIMMGEVLMSDLPVRTRQLFWNNLQIAWPTPGSYLKDQNRVYRMAAIKQREALKTLDQVAKLVLNNLSLQPEHLLFIGTRKAALAFALCGYAYARPDIASVARVAKRYFDFTETDDASDRQILIGLLIGEDVSGHAFAGLLEIGQRICSAKEPACLFCPLRPSCAFAKTRGLSRDHDDAGSSEILSATAVLDAEEWAERVEAH